jgi:glycosyltransferase involved in cell wall biosynthesis
MFKECSFYQSYIWAHDTSLISSGSYLNEIQILTKWNKYINKCICLTEWHKNEFTINYPILKDKIDLINNGLDINSFTPFLFENAHSEAFLSTKSNVAMCILNAQRCNIDTNKKIKNKFIYSSRSERGLHTLLKLWPQILEKIPDATLSISSYELFPSNSDDILLKNIIDSNNSVKHLGKLNTNQLYYEMTSSEFWLYPTHYPETSCITALEMLMSEVICLYYPVAGLTCTMDKYGIQVRSGNEIDTIVSLTDEQKETLRKNGRTYAEQCSWENRYIKWHNLLSLNLYHTGTFL